VSKCMPRDGRKGLKEDGRGCLGARLPDGTAILRRWYLVSEFMPRGRREGLEGDGETEGGDAAGHDFQTVPQ
jgi:hypothetical protein